MQNGWISLTVESYQVSVSRWGAALGSVRIPDRQGQLAEVCLGYPDSEAYRQNPSYLGAIIGRVANRIANSQFHIDGRTHTLIANEGVHHLHGGPTGFHQVQWDAVPFATQDFCAVRLTHRSPDGEGGYPGNLDVEVTYALYPNGRLSLLMTARTDQCTPVSLTHHPYWNLCGAGTIHDHVLQVQSDAFTPNGPDMIPTGEQRLIEGTPLDLREPQSLGTVIENTGGLDHNYVLPTPPESLQNVAVLSHPKTGRCLRLSTTLPGLQVYSAGGLSGGNGHDGRPLQPFGGVCLEPQYFPNAINEPRFHSPILHPDEQWQHRIDLDFSPIA